MTKEINYRNWIWTVHLLFWLLLTVIMIFIFAQLFTDEKVIVTAVCVNLIGFTLLVYAHLHYLLPTYFDKKRFGKYTLGLMLLLLITSILRFSTGWIIIRELGSEAIDSFTPTYFGNVVLGGAFLLLISIPLRLVNDYFRKNELEKELKTHQLEAELRFLKAQVNPHFLFNALNNIYSLSFTESKKTPEMILKLSGMMSYMLYECKNESVSLSSEIEYLKNYIELQQLKKDGEFNIEFKILGDCASIQITPMLFIPFFENAFKHGNIEDTKNGWIKSQLKIEQANLHFSISNSLKIAQKTAEKSGVGLSNIRERLNLLFPNQHQLVIQKTEKTYSVNLSINLSQ